MAEDQPPVESAASDQPKAQEEAANEPPASASGDAGSDVASAGAASEAGIDQAAIDEILRQASFEDPAEAMRSAVPTAESAGAGTQPSAAAVAQAAPMRLPDFQQVMHEAQVNSIDLLRDVDLNVKIELGRSRMLVEDVLKLAEGSVVELDKLAGDPVDVFVNERLVARGEVLVLNDSFCVRINEIVAGVKEEGL